MPPIPGGRCKFILTGGSTPDPPILTPNPDPKRVMGSFLNGISAIA